MNSDLITRVQQSLAAGGDLDPSRPVLAGVSGGPDSLCMLHILWRLGLQIIIAHLDHQLRPESATEAQAVARLAERWDLPVILGRQDVHALAESGSLSIEEAAREARYRFLFSEAERCSARAVVVGHTADDQVETVLMHLLRGSGTAGLRGMAYRSLPTAWSQEIPLVRPILGVWRSEVLAYLESQHLVPLQDATNLDVRYYRNYLRHELIPYLEKDHPRLRQRIWHMAEVVRQDYAILEKVFDQARQETLTFQGDGYVVLDRQKFIAQPLGIQRGLVRWTVNLLRPGLRDFDFETTQAVIDFAHSPSHSAQRDLAAGVRLFIEEDSLWLATWEADLPSMTAAGELWPQILPGSEFQVESPGCIQLSGAWRLVVALASDLQAARRNALHNPDPYTAWVDSDRLKFPLEVRSRRRGDRFQPLGMAGHSLKLADFMVNVKLPRRARDTWPLIISLGKIAWVPGYRLAEPFRVTEESTNILRLSLEHSKE